MLCLSASKARAQGIIGGKRYLCRLNYVLVQNTPNNYLLIKKIVQMFYKAFIMIWISCNNY